MMVFPFSESLVLQDLHDVAAQRGALSVIGGIALLWAASGYFNILARNVNLAWPKIKLRSFVQNRLVALGMLGALAVLLMLSLLTTTVINLLPQLVRAYGGSHVLANMLGWRVFIQSISVLSTYVMFVALYRWVPNKIVHWHAALIGAAFVTLAWDAAKGVFTLYLGSGLAHYQSVYGSLGTLIALMVWIYLSNVIALFGAYLVAGFELHKELKNPVSVYTPSESGKAVIAPSALNIQQDLPVRRQSIRKDA
jgi:membrane protein